MKQDKPLHPVEVSFLRPDTVMLHQDDIPRFIQHCWLKRAGVASIHRFLSTHERDSLWGAEGGGVGIEFFWKRGTVRVKFLQRGHFSHHGITK